MNTLTDKSGNLVQVARYAIDTRSKEGHGFIGIHWPGVKESNGLAGTAFWVTTNGAAPVLADVRKTWPKAKLVRVRERVQVV